IRWLNFLVIKSEIIFKRGYLRFVVNSRLSAQRVLILKPDQIPLKITMYVDHVDVASKVRGQRSSASVAQEFD
ncbi:unnamed protein product, partial [Larinioides sclopetarius]